MNRFVRAFFVAVSLLLGPVLAAAAGPNHVSLMEIRGPITPAIVSYVDRGITIAEEAGATLVVIQLDTPGGLDDSTRKIMQRIIASRVPVVVYVAPSGARAASAGLFITQAAHIAAMAPDTNIGSAHPVQLGGSGSGTPDSTMTQKIENDAAAIARSVAETRGRNGVWVERAVRESVNLAAREALEQNVVDIVAPDLDGLLRALDGRIVRLSSGQTRTLAVANVDRQRVDMTIAERVLLALTDPTLAYLLLTIGMYGLIYEFANPGGWFPGVAGFAALVVALFALGTLPVNWAGMALIALAFGLFLADVLAVNHGGLAAAGAIVLALGSIFLFPFGDGAFSISPVAIAGVVTVTFAFFGIVVSAVVRTARRPPTTGREGLIGGIAIVARDLAPRGKVQIEGELWTAETTDGTRATRGDRVRVQAMDGMTLRVVAVS